MSKKRIPKWQRPHTARQMPRLAVPEGLKEYDFDPPSARLLIAENEKVGRQIDQDHKRRAEELGKNL